jgi:hypothetical protein
MPSARPSTPSLGAAHPSTSPAPRTLTADTVSQLSRGVRTSDGVIDDGLSALAASHALAAAHASAASAKQYPISPMELKLDAIRAHPRAACDSRPGTASSDLRPPPRAAGAITASEAHHGVVALTSGSGRLLSSRPKHKGNAEVLQMG